MTLSASSHPAAEDSIPPLAAKDLDILHLFSLAHDPKAGAVVLFSGEVRDNSAGKPVSYLAYEAFEVMAEKMIKDILAEAIIKFNLTKAIAQHRVGKVAAGGCAVVVITCSAHRKEAYAANRYIIDRIKHEAPIWKCEYFADGTKEWGGNCSCQKITGDANKHVYEFDHSSH